MKLSNAITDILLNADGKALATAAPKYPNVIPVSTIKIVDEKIVLVNYFMGKTLENIQEDSNVSLACWKGLEGYQIKATATYAIEGETVTSIREWVAEILPDRKVRGVLILTPQEVYDVSATTGRTGVKMAL